MSKMSGRDVVCPFFCKEVSIAVSCESYLDPEGRVKLCFSDGKKKERYMTRHCKSMTGYKRCLIARALECRYEREKERSEKR